jgi:integrase
MPRPRLPARLVLRSWRGAAKVWYIVDGRSEISTGCSERDIAGAEARLAIHTGAKYDPAQFAGKGLRISVATVLDVYLREHAPTVAKIDFLHATALPLGAWWSEKWLSDVNKKSCTDYVKWRTSQTGRHKRRISIATARHDLKTLRAAIRYFHASEYGPLPSVPAVTLPPKPEPKSDFLTRSEVARLLWAAKSAAWTERRRYSSRVNERWTAPHLVRFILIGVYTGSRSGRILSLRWTPSHEGGHVDLAARIIYRKPAADVESRKRAPKVRIHDRLLPWLRRWQRHDESMGVDIICHWQGAEVDRLEKSWDTAIELSGLPAVTPHVLRHSCTTWLLQAGVSIWEVAGFVGMSEATVRDVYGHFHPDYQHAAASSKHGRIAKRPTVADDTPGRPGKPVNDS